MRRDAFSLVEVLVVLVILSLAAAAVVLRVQTPTGKAAADEAAGRLAAFDQLARAVARQQDRPVQLIFELGSGRLVRTADDGTALGAPAELPENCALSALWVNGQSAGPQGSAGVRCSRAGLTPSYGLRLEAPGGIRRWLVVCGLTGQAVEVDNEQELLDILAAAAGRGADAR